MAMLRADAPEFVMPAGGMPASPDGSTPPSSPPRAGLPRTPMPSSPPSRPEAVAEGSATDASEIYGDALIRGLAAAMDTAAVFREDSGRPAVETVPGKEAKAMPPSEAMPAAGLFCPRCAARRPCAFHAVAVAAAAEQRRSTAAAWLMAGSGHSTQAVVSGALSYGAPVDLPPQRSNITEAIGVGRTYTAAPSHLQKACAAGFGVGALTGASAGTSLGGTTPSEPETEAGSSEPHYLESEESDASQTGGSELPKSVPPSTVTTVLARSSPHRAAVVAARVVAR